MKKILLVDDDSLSVEFMRLFIESEGFITLSAGTCEEAIAVYKEHSPEIIITDIELTDGSGVDFAQLVKDSGSDGAMGSTPRIIGVTGHSREHLESCGNDTSVFDFLLTKPVDLNDLKNCVTR